ncbi:hypothetical protein P879_09385 [Paragonimus westermani]|uniref:Uncharacterized protein n=1 Tax=Paragonimus westermani TaxID=34504 RepID=A0A8T0D313_9TREM|nr:hypothetical protein P879_09385 [Paragonimus westermani]
MLYHPRVLLTRLFTVAQKLAKEPVNFSWVSENVAGFGFPSEKEEWDFLSNVAKLSHVITMCPENPVFATSYPEITHHHLPVDDLTAADLPVIKKAMQIIQDAETKNEKTGVHCKLGGGRVGTILACYLAYKHDWNADTAISQLRKVRPKSINSNNEEAVRQYVMSLKS